MSEFKNIIIRQVTAADLPALEWEGEFTHFRRLYAEAFRKSKMGEAVLWAAELLEKGIIGQVFVTLHYESDGYLNKVASAYVYGFRVQESYRNQGIGTVMMSFVEFDLLQRGFNKIILNVSKTNQDARRLYERLGYQVVGSDPGLWSYLDQFGKLREVHEPAWKMVKELNGKVSVDKSIPRLIRKS